MFFSTNQANAVIDFLNSRYNINICIITLNAGQQIFATTVTNMCRLIIRMNQLLWNQMSFIIVIVYKSIDNLISADCHIINKGSNNWKFNQKFEHIFSTSGCFCQFIQISRADTNNMVVVFCLHLACHHYKRKRITSCNNICFFINYIRNKLIH